VAPTTVPAPATTVPAPVTSAPPTTAAGDNCEPGTRSSKVQTPGGEFTLVATTPACEAYAGFNVNGRIGVDAADGDSAAIVYVVDLSGSTGSSDDLDCNGDGTFNDGDKFVGSRNGGTILDCEVAGIIALNDSLAGSNTRVGLVGFGASAAAADVSPAGGTQLFTSPTADVNNDGQRDIETVARSLRGARINEFGGSTNVGFLTDFESALDASIAALDTVDADQKVIFFLSDGNSNDGVDQARTAAGKGIVINTYGVGAGASECGDNDRLGDFARITNGKCTNVVDPSGLSTTLIAAVPVGVDRVEVTVDGGAVRPATLDALGNWSVGTFDVPDGVHTVEATAFTDDGSSTSIEFGILKMAPAA